MTNTRLLAALALTGAALAPSVHAQDLSQEELYAALALEDRATPVVRVVQAVTPAVVFIETEAHHRVRTIFGIQNQRVAGAGSGVVVHPAGYVVTNYHVVEGAQELRVSFDGDPNKYRAELASYVREEDLALLKILDVPEALRLTDVAGGRRSAGGGLLPSAEVAFPTVRLGTSADLMPGEPVVAIGNPHGQTHTVSTGIISGLHRDVAVPQRRLHFHGLIQTDASINRGNSGGPLLNIRGELIGINTAMNEAAENIGFAIPVDRVRQVLTDTLFPQARRSWLGFELAEGDELIVSNVWPDSPADHAGICSGDRIVSIDGIAVTGAEDFQLRSLQLEPGRDVVVQVDRGGARDSLVVRTWDQLDGMLFQRLGVVVAERDLGGRPYLLVEKVRTDSPADEVGVRPGDLLPALRPRVGRRPVAFTVRDKETLASIVGQLPEGAAVEIDVYRDANENRTYERSERLNGVLRLL